MITVVVNFDLPADVTRADAAEKFRESAPKYRAVPGLVRKNYLFNADQRKGGGAYLFETREQAEALFNADFVAMITERYGAPPTITYFDTPVVVDNLAGEIIAD